MDVHRLRSLALIILVSMPTSMEFISVPDMSGSFVHVDLAALPHEDRHRKSSPMREIIRRLSLRYRKKRPEKEGGRRPRPREY